MRKLVSAGVLGLALLAGGCGGGSKLADIQSKTQKIETKEELEKVLGKPKKMSSGGIGGLTGDTYIYEAPDGQATFVILNGKIMSRLYTSSEKK